MGLFTALITLPLAPVRAVAWIGDTVANEAYRQWTDPATVRAELDRTEQRWRAGEITEAQRNEIEDALLARLFAGRQQRSAAHG